MAFTSLPLIPKAPSSFSHNLYSSIDPHGMVSVRKTLVRCRHEERKIFVALSAATSNTPDNITSSTSNSTAPTPKKATSNKTRGPELLDSTSRAPSKAVTALCIGGFVLVSYALYVSSMATAAPALPIRKLSKAAAMSGAAKFKAWCDFSTAASCSTVAKSQYGVGLGLINANGPWGFLALPNAVYGMVLYLAIFLTNLPSTFASARARQIALILSTCSLFVSVYLGYLLAFVLKNLCVVCVATYLVNAALFSLCWADYKSALASLRTGEASGSGTAAQRAKGLIASDRSKRDPADSRQPQPAEDAASSADNKANSS